MPVLWVFAVSCLLWQIGILSTEESERIAPAGVARSSDEVDHYRAFLYLADHYMKNQSTPSALTQRIELTAKDLLSNLGTQHSLSVDAFPGNWRLVVSSNAHWATCTPMSEEALGLVAQLVRASSSGPKMQLVSRQGLQAWVISEDAKEDPLCL